MREKNWLEGNIKYSSRFCQYAGRVRPGCKKCVTSCPSGALHPDQGCITLDKNACTECGDCISVCPSGALSRRAGEIETIHREIMKHTGEVIVFCDSASWHGEILPGLRHSLKRPGILSPVLLENIGFLSIVEFALAAHHSGKAVIIPSINVDVSHRAFAREADLIGDITSFLFSRRMVHVPRNIRDFEKVIDEVTGWDRIIFPLVNVSMSDISKRERLGVIIAAWLRTTSKIGDSSSHIPHNSFAKISCDPELCISCGACANQCKVRALHISSDGERLLHIPFLCVNCGVCTDVCPENALSANPGLLLSRDFLNVREIAHFQMVKCRSCGRPFTTEKKSLRVLETLKALLGNDPVREKLLQFCPECRPVQAFTTYSQWTKERR